MKRLLIFCAFTLLNFIQISAQDKIAWKAESILEYLSSNTKPVMVYIRRAGDHFCRRMEATTLSDQDIVKDINENFVIALLEVSEPKPFEFANQQYANPIEFMKRNGVESPSVPTIMFFDLNSKISKVLKGMKSVEELQAGIQKAKDMNFKTINQRLEDHESEYIKEAEQIVNASTFCANQASITEDAFGDMEQLKGEYQGGGFGASGHYKTKVQFDNVPWKGTITEGEGYIRSTYHLINAQIGKYKKLEGTMKRLITGVKNCSLPGGGNWTGERGSSKINYQVTKSGTTLNISLTESKGSDGDTNIYLEYLVEKN